LDSFLKDWDLTVEGCGGGRGYIWADRLSESYVDRPRRKVMSMRWLRLEENMEALLAMEAELPIELSSWD
jgi:hypothetical protein